MQLKRPVGLSSSFVASLFPAFRRPSSTSLAYRPLPKPRRKDPVGLRLEAWLGQRGAPPRQQEYLPLPGAGGAWDGAPGNSGWHSKKPQVLKVTHGRSVQFRDGFPNFAPWAQMILQFPEDALRGEAHDMHMADRRLAEVGDLKNTSAARRHRQENRLVWHHCEDARTLQLLPIDLHQNVAHTGGAAILRRRNKRSQPRDACPVPPPCRQAGDSDRF